MRTLSFKIITMFVNKTDSKDLKLDDLTSESKDNNEYYNVSYKSSLTRLAVNAKLFGRRVSLSRKTSDEFGFDSSSTNNVAVLRDKSTRVGCNVKPYGKRVRVSRLTLDKFGSNSSWISTKSMVVKSGAMFNHMGNKLV
jgi:hypothetical protein